MEVADVEFDLGNTSNSNRTGGETLGKPSEGGSGKRLRETNVRSRSLTPKRNKTSPPALREMEAVHFIKAKSEPEDFDAQEGEDYFLDEPLESYLNSQDDGKKGKESKRTIQIASDDDLLRDFAKSNVKVHI